MTPTVFTRILVPIDFSGESKAALSAAASLAHAVGASVHLLHVVRDPLLSVGTPEPFGIDWVKLRDEIAAEARTRLSVLARTVPGITVTVDVLVGRPADLIAKVARKTSTDLIVMGTHGRGIMGQLLIGSVADRVIRLAPCPVMTVREPGGTHPSVADAEAGDHEAAVRG